MTVLVGGVKAVRATARMPTHAMRLHDWGTRRLTSTLSAQHVRVLSWASQVGTSHVNDPLDCGRSCGVVRGIGEENVDRTELPFDLRRRTAQSGQIALVHHNATPS